VMFIVNLAQWEVYFSSHLMLGPFNVTELECIMITIQLVTFISGAAIWRTPIHFLGYTTPLAEFVNYGAYLGGVLNFVQYNLLVYRSTSDPTNYWKQPLSLLRWRAAVTVAPVYWTTAWVLAWAFISPSTYLMHLNWFGVGFGFVFANLVGRLVTARVTHLESPNWIVPIVPLPLLVANAYFRWLPELPVLQAFAIFAVIAYLHFGLGIVEDLADYLKINAFSIPYPNAATKDDLWAKLFDSAAVAASIEMNATEAAAALSVASPPKPPVAVKRRKSSQGARRRSSKGPVKSV